jgi:tRNA modification GTPase
MRDINDTIAAISSASLTNGTIGKSIIRITGPKAISVIDKTKKASETFNSFSDKRFLSPLIFEISETLSVHTNVYVFRAPNSYTGQDLVEIHLFAAECIIEILLSKILRHARPAEAGEFTLRAYLNGKIDLSQAEAVAAIVSGSSSFQLNAAEKLLTGSLRQNITRVRNDMIELMSKIEAGMDFSEEDIEFISKDQSYADVDKLIEHLKAILTSSVRYEEMIDMVSIGLAGSANVGKSTLINRLLGTNRSIVTDEMGTTRDILEGVLELENTRCAIFDCAGIKEHCDNLLDSLANQSAIDSLKTAELVLLCIDVTNFDINETERLLKLIDNNNVMFVLTKCDLANLKLVDEYEQILTKSITRKYTDSAHHAIVAISSKNGFGIDELKKQIEKFIVHIQAGSTEAAEKIAINQRHRQLIQTAVNTLNHAKHNIQNSSNEIAVMLLRQAYKSLGSIQNEHIDEKILDRIFSQFCIGK